MENANATAFIYNMILIYIAYQSYIMLTNTYTANHKKNPKFTAIKLLWQTTFQTMYI